MKSKIEVIDVNAGNVDETGFFCCMSKRKSEGYQRKLRWAKARFAEGMKIKILGQGERGFIEYIPGEHAWRPVNAAGFLFIHCLWVVGKSKGKGLGAHLLDQCIEDARRRKMKGVAMVTTEGNWLAGKKLLMSRGFHPVDQAPPSFELMVKKFGQPRSPSFPKDWETRAGRFGKGLTILRSDQCPYLDDAVNKMLKVGKARGMRARVVDLNDCATLRDTAPSPYGVFSVVYSGKLLSYHYLTEKEFQKRLDTADA